MIKKAMRPEQIVEMIEAASGQMWRDHPKRVFISEIGRTRIDARRKAIERCAQIANKRALEVSHPGGRLEAKYIASLILDQIKKE